MPHAGDGTLALTPGTQTLGRLVVPGDAATSIRLENRGPGAVDFVVRMANGVDLQKGALDSATISFTPAARVVILVVLDARPGEPSTVAWSVDGAGGATFEWR